MRLRVWLAAWAAAVASLAFAAAAGEARTRPVLLLPGFASSQLEAWSHSRCETGFRKNLYRDVNIGDRLWIDIGRVLAQSDCWIRCMRLDIATQDETACKLRAVDGVNGISELDPGLVTGPLSNVWRTLIKDLVQHFHLEPDQLVVAAYDWRLPAAKLQERDRYFFRLMKQIEYTVELNGGEALVVIAHSMGNNMLRYFLAWLKLEIGVNHWQEWIDKHIAAYFAVGAPLLGSTESLELLATGVTNGLPVTQSAIRELVISFGAIISFMPIPSGQPSAADDQVLFSMRYHDRLHAHGDSVERVVNYTSADIASGQFFRDLAAKDPLFGDLEIARRRFYAEDRVLDHFSAWERPPIANVYSVYGVNIPAADKYDYQRTAGVEEWTMLEREYEDGDDTPELCGKTGDGTVPYHSLSWAHTWLGKAGTKVGVTQTPQSVYFSADDIREVSAVRTAVSHHAQYAQALNGKSLCLADESVYRESGSSSSGGFFNGLFGSSTEDQITFYESTEEVSSGVRTTSVWEVDGARHREILSSPSFLRELRMELRHIFNGKTSADKTSRPPMIDTDCYWNYRQARCEFSEFCEYRYTFGDVTLDQSCRLRPSKQPPAPIHSGELVTPESSSSRTSEKMELKDNAPMSSSRPYCTGSACSSCAAYNECTPLHAMA